MNHILQTISTIWKQKRKVKEDENKNIFEILDDEISEDDE